MQSQLQKLCKDLRDRIGFVKSQQRLGSECMTLVGDQVNAFIAAVRQCKHLTCSDAVVIADVMNESDVFDGNDKKRVAAALELASAEHDKVNVTKDARSPQACRGFENFGTQPLWSDLENADYTFECKVEILGKFMFRGGLVSPDTSVKKRAISMIQAASGGGDLTGTRKRELAQKLVSSIKRCDKAKRYPLAHLLEYPHEPVHLPGAHFEHWYGGESPINMPDKYADILPNLVDDMVVRKSHSSVKKSAGQHHDSGSIVCQQSGMPPPVMQHNNQGFCSTDPMQQLFSMVMGLQASVMHHQGNQHRGPPPCNIAFGRRRSDVSDSSDAGSPRDKQDADNKGQPSSNTQLQLLKRRQSPSNGGDTHQLQLQGAATQRHTEHPQKEQLPTPPSLMIGGAVKIGEEDSLDDFIGKVRATKKAVAAVKKADKVEKAAAKKAAAKKPAAPAGMKRPAAHADDVDTPAAPATKRGRPVDDVDTAYANLSPKQRRVVDKLSTSLLTAEIKGDKPPRNFNCSVYSRSRTHCKNAGMGKNDTWNVMNFMYKKAGSVYSDL